MCFCKYFGGKGQVYDTILDHATSLEKASDCLCINLDSNFSIKSKTQFKPPSHIEIGKETIQKAS